MSRSSRFSAGRSRVPPEMPPSIVAVGHQHPALGLLAGDIGLAGLALGIERVELHVRALFASDLRV